MWSSAAAAHLLQGSTCCAFRDGVLHSSVGTSAYLPSFFGLFSVNPEMVVGDNPSRSADSDILRPARLALTTMPLSLKSPFFPILMLGLNFSKLS